MNSCLGVRAGGPAVERTGTFSVSDGRSAGQSCGMCAGPWPTAGQSSPPAQRHVIQYTG